MNKNINDLKIAVVGLGGVGGYLAGVLAAEHPHVQVVARGARYDAIAEKGLVLHSDYRGNLVSRPESIVASSMELDTPDILFLCVKNYSLEQACQELQSIVNENTIVVPVMNGADPGARVAMLLPQCQVVQSLIYIVSYANADYSITQEGNFTRIFIGVDDKLRTADSDAATSLVHQVLSVKGIEIHTAEDITCEIWRKYVLNCAYNVATARYGTTIGPLRENPKTAAEFEALVNEAYQVGLASDVKLLPEHVDYIINRFYHEYAYDAGSSMQRDVAAGRPAELETFSGHIVREALRLGIDAPVSERFYQELLEIVK